MKKNDVKQIVLQIAKKEFTLYPESYSFKENGSTGSYVENVSQWALNTWECRTDEEIIRDRRLGLHPDNYTVWAFEAFESIYHSKQNVSNDFKLGTSKIIKPHRRGFST